ncbi:MAG: CoA transferase [Chloroflexota bacterium]|nr:CoA transferase [Chloroflexota bacterium]MDE2941208.1 CoA transferase [Chloroflexota bacterium]MDE3268187.1 CoA transferase [Chloroflexota bacterium]
MAKPLPLEGIRVLDFTHIVAGPQCTRILGDLGAQVIKVEQGQAMDVTRSAALGGIGGIPGVNRSGMFEYFNRNKLSITINALLPAGLDLIKKLVAVSDVVIENFSSRVLERWGLSYEEQCELKPDIIYVSVTGFGHIGRLRDYSTWGPTAQALSGLTFMSGLPGERPAGWGYSFLDHTAGYNAAIATLMAIHHRNRTGEGQWLDVSQVESGMVLTGPAVLDYTANGRPYRRPGNPTGNRSANPRVAPHNAYRCAGDDEIVAGEPRQRWCVISIFTEEDWQKFCKAIGSPEWTADPKFATNVDRVANEDELDRLIEEWTIDKMPHEVMHRLQAAGVAAGAVQTNEDKVVRDPQLRSREFIQKVPHREVEDSFETDSLPFKFSHTEHRIRQASPPLGSDTQFILTEVLGLSEGEITELAEQAVF